MVFWTATRFNMKPLSRRAALATFAVLPAALAQPNPQQPAAPVVSPPVNALPSPAEDVAKNGAQLAAIDVPMSLEPDFVFKP